MKVFPLWTKELGHAEVAIEGVDLKIHDESKYYRQAVAQIKYDPFSLGALVTTHKIDLMEAARDMFDYLDPYARICGEVSCISKRNGALEAHAKDPITSGLSLDSILGDNYFGIKNGHLLCFGAGGAVVAIVLHLINKKRSGDRPERIIIVNRSQGRLDRLQKMVEGLQTDIAFEYILNQDARRNDEIMADLPSGSVVINGTGMGKDSPGSPITTAGLFPMDGVVWELNYRGELDFMHQGLAQKHSRNLKVEDGWLYFLHGWTQVIAQVYHITINKEIFNHLAKIAAEIRKS